MRNALALGEASSIAADLFPLPAPPQNLPLFKTLTPAQNQAVLVRNSVGRIAFALNGRVQLLPINYVYLNRWIYGRTAATEPTSGIYRRVLSRIRRLVRPTAETPSVLFRDQLFAIQAIEISGRASLSVEGRFFAS